MSQRSTAFGEAPGEDCLPELAGQVEQAGLGIMGDAIEDAFRRVDRSPLLWAHRLPEHAKVGNPIDASACRVDPHDVAGGEDIAEEFAANKLKLVETLDVARRLVLMRIAKVRGSA